MGQKKWGSTLAREVYGRRKGKKYNLGKRGRSRTLEGVKGTQVEGGGGYSSPPRKKVAWVRQALQPWYDVHTVEKTEPKKREGIV